MVGRIRQEILSISVSNTTGLYKPGKDFSEINPIHNTFIIWLIFMGRANLSNPEVRRFNLLPACARWHPIILNRGVETGHSVSTGRGWTDKREPFQVDFSS
jgi:hypothetical protein